MARDRYRSVQEYGLTAGTLGSSAAQTVMVALFPLLLAPYAPSAVWIGLVIGGEGLFALVVPYWIGHLSDHLPERWARRFGRRTLFLLATAPIMAAVLAISPFLEGYWVLAAVSFVFFAAFHAYTTPLWALMVDAVPDERRGRVHGVRGALQAGGMAYGLVAGGLLFALWEPLPFLLCALIVLVTTALTHIAAPADSRDPTGSEQPVEGSSFWRTIRERPAIGWFLTANALWTGAIDGIRPYVFLYAGLVLGIGTAKTSLVLLLLVGGLAVGSVALGHMGDRYGRFHLLSGGALLTGLTMASGFFVRDLPGAVLLLTFAGLGAAALIALPYPLFAALMGQRATGRSTGVYIVSLGLARTLAPVLVGAAIDAGAPLFPALKGYPLMWPIAGGLALLSVPVLRKAGRYRDTTVAFRKGGA